jgi:crotonobetainyl-CoA:carnitine CoA-transferase CaiB-like acyl-CoA transferase
MKNGPLHGIRVLEIASMIFGPVAGQYLGDMGDSALAIMRRG